MEDLSEDSENLLIGVVLGLLAVLLYVGGIWLISRIFG